MDNDLKFSEYVILIDVAFLNVTVHSAKEPLERKMGRKLPNINLPGWLSYLALDAGLRGENNEIQVLLLHDESIRKLECFEPVDLHSLDGKACRTPVGEFAFSYVTPADITSCEELYLDLMNMALDSASVKRLMLVPFHPLYGNGVEDNLRMFFKGKSEEECAKAVYFVMEEPQEPVFSRWDYISYSLLQAFGIKSEELK